MFCVGIFRLIRLIRLILFIRLIRRLFIRTVGVSFYGEFCELRELLAQVDMANYSNSFGGSHFEYYASYYVLRRHISFNSFNSFYSFNSFNSFNSPFNYQSCWGLFLRRIMRITRIACAGRYGLVSSLSQPIFSKKSTAVWQCFSLYGE